MNYEEAIALFEEFAPGEALWKRHSLRVAEVSHAVGRALAEAGEPVEPESARVSGLFHDLGRAKTHGPAHGWVGYVLLRRRGLERHARGCISHWTKGRSLDEMVAEGRWSPRFLRHVFDDLGFRTLSLEDRAVAFADSVVMHDRVVTVEERSADLERRYGDGPWLRRNLELSILLRNEVETRIGRPLASVLRPLHAR